MSTFEQLIAELTRDANRVQPKDALQYCSNWFQLRLEEQRARTRDVLSIRGRSPHPGIPADYILLKTPYLPLTSKRHHLPQTTHQQCHPPCSTAQCSPFPER